MDFRAIAMNLVDEHGVQAEELLIACLKYMSQSEVADMLTANDYEFELEVA